jgi:hypothetical protein
MAQLKIGVLSERDLTEVGPAGKCGHAEVGVLSERILKEVRSSWENKSNEIIPISLAMNSKSLGEGVCIFCGVRRM